MPSSEGKDQAKVRVDSRVTDQALVYDDAEHEPELHWRTYVAMVSMCLIQFVQLSAIIGPPTVLTFIADDLHGSKARNWIVNVITLAQAALGPVLSSASDTFQSRKTIIVAMSTIAMIGSAIAPGSHTVYRLIGAQTLVGLGLAAAPLTYAVPSEMLPRRWRPIAQALINTTGSMGAIVGPIMIGALLRGNPGGWRNFYWIQTALWGSATLAILVGYRPLKRRTRFENYSFLQKLKQLDLAGSFLLTAGVTLCIAGLNLGGNLFSWSSGQTLGPLISGILGLIAFGAYETWGTKTGILHHDLFRGKSRRPLVILCTLFFIEGLMFFATAVWYPVIVAALFETDPLLIAVYLTPLVIPAIFVSMIYGAISSRVKSVRWPLMVGFALWTGGLVGQATIQPGQNTITLGTLALLGVGLAGPLMLILAGTHLSVPAHLMATGSAAVVCSRAFGATIFTAIYSAVVTNRLDKFIPAYIAKAVLPLGLKPTLLGEFIGLLTTYDFATLAKIRGVTPEIIGAGTVALRQAFADGVRVVFIIAACFGVLACVLCACLPSVREVMDYKVEAPVEVLHNKLQHADEKA